LPRGSNLFAHGGSILLTINRLGIRTIGDLARCPAEILLKQFGKYGITLYRWANGIDHSPVNPNSLDVVKGISNSYTLPRDCAGDEIKIAVIDLCETVAMRVRKGGYVGRRVGLTLRDMDLIFYHWTRTLPEYTDLTEDVIDVALDLLNANWPLWKPVRLVGVSFNGLVKKKWEQTDMFEEKERLRRLTHVCDDLKEQYGEKVLMRGVLLQKKSKS